MERSRLLERIKLSAIAWEPRLKKIDLKGRTVLPGFIDVHTHALYWAKSIVRGEIDAGYPVVHTIGDIKAAVAEKGSHCHSRAMDPWPKVG